MPCSGNVYKVLLLTNVTVVALPARQTHFVAFVVALVVTKIVVTRRARDVTSWSVIRSLADDAVAIRQLGGDVAERAVRPL